MSLNWVLSANGTAWPNTLAEPPMSCSHCATRCRVELTAKGVRRPKLLISAALLPVRFTLTPEKGLPVMAICTAPGLKLPRAAMVMGRFAFTVAPAKLRPTRDSRVVPWSSPSVTWPAASASGFATLTCMSASRLTLPLATLAPRKPTLTPKLRPVAWMSPARVKLSNLRKKASSVARPGVRSTPKAKSRCMLAARSRAPPSAVMAMPFADWGTVRSRPFRVRLASSTRSKRTSLPYWSPVTADRPATPARALTRPSVVLAPGLAR